MAGTGQLSTILCMNARSRTEDNPGMSPKTRFAATAARAATWASRATGKGSGGMIGGLIAQKLDPRILAGLGGGRPAAIITGTNGKSTTTRLMAAAMRTTGTVATNDGGDNMDAGVISALLANKKAQSLVLEVDELHVAHIAADLKPETLVLLNLSRDQLDRVGEINSIERALRKAVDENPQATIIANCDDPLITAAAWDAKKIVWVSAGGSWFNDASTCPRTGGAIIHSDGDWFSSEKLPDGTEFRRPSPDWAVSDEGLLCPDGQIRTLNLTLPGRANRGNAAQAIAAAVTMGADLDTALTAVSTVDSVAGRYSTVRVGKHEVRMLLAKNPAGWQEALSMLDRSAEGVVIAVNGHVADGEDLSWLWDVQFEDFGDTVVHAAGERGTDLAVRLLYADIEHELTKDSLKAIAACPPGRVEVLANYTAFRDLKRAIEKGATSVAQNN